MKQKKSIFSYFQAVSLMMPFVFAVVSSFLSYREIYTRFDKNVNEIQTTQMAAKKAFLTGEVMRFVDLIHTRTEAVYHETRDKIAQRVDEAYRIATAIYALKKNDYSDEQIQKIIIETLRALRYEDGKGYYFIIRRDGVEILYPEKPQIEGTNLITSENNHLSGVVKEIIKIASNQKEGYCEYLWDKPEEKEGSFKKLTYVKLFEPYNWIIGTGLYLDDMEKRVKDELVSNTDRLIFDKKMGSYIFMGTWEGVSLTYPAPNVDLYNLQDIHGKFPVRELIATAQSGGGFVEYEMPPLQGERPLRKLSYTTNLPQWKAYVGAGIYLNDIYEEIEKLNVLAKEEFKRSLLVIMWTILGFILFLFIVCHVENAHMGFSVC